jgi:hypothetical protein
MHLNHQIIYHLQDALNLIPDLPDSSIPHVPSAIEAEEAEDALNLLPDLLDSPIPYVPSAIEVEEAEEIG